MVFSGKNFFFRHDRVFWSQWLRKLTVWKVTYSPPVFSFLLSLTERLLIAWLRINKNSWYTKTVSFREEYERSKMITSGKIEHSAKCCFSILLKPFNESTVWTPPFSERPCWEKYFSFVYVCWILSEIFENNSFKFVTNSGKSFLMGVVSRTSFMILLHLSLNYSLWINPYLSLFVIRR